MTVDFKTWLKHSYTLLQSTVNEQKDGAFLIIMGDFNAKLGTDWENADGAIDLA